MSDANQTTILRAFRLLLRPLVRILLRGGITWKQAADVCKATFVEVATDEFGLHGRPTNISRVAIMTGLGRRDVSRLRRLIDAEQPVDLGRMNSASRLLTGWHVDPDYLTGSGRPRDLSFDDGPISFTSLAHKYAGDIAPVTMQRELLIVGALAELDDRSLRALKRYYMPLAMDDESILRAGSVLQDLGNTMDYNLTREETDPTRFEGRATNSNVRAVDAVAFREFLESEAQALLERADAWLALREPSPDAKRQYKTTRIGIGIYQIQDDEH
jgi:hypothetical protein